MSTLLAGTPPTREERYRHDTYKAWVVLVVLATLCVYAYLFTHIAVVVNLPLPRDLAQQWGISMPYVFDDDRNLNSNIQVFGTRRWNNDDERLVLFGIVAVAFLGAYFLPLGGKQPAIVVAFLAACWVLYGSTTTLALIWAHVLIYVVFHPEARDSIPASALLGALGVVTFYGNPLAARNTVWAETLCAAALVAGVVSLTLYRYAFPYLRACPRLLAGLRLALIQSPLLLGCALALHQGLGGKEWKLPLGLMLAFWHWERLMLYHIDYQSGDVPADIPLWGYLAVFMSPAVLPNWYWNPYVGQGYGYLAHNFLCRDKNQIVLSGVKLWGYALVYQLIGDWLVYGIMTLCQDYLHIRVYRFISTLVREHVHGTPMSTPTVLLSCLLDQIRILVLLASIVHFKVGCWRVFGYDMDPQYNQPWRATNLSQFWTRYAFHYRGFLVRAFYYPVFFRLFKRHFLTRVFVATMAAAALGNLVWGHIPDDLNSDGFRFAVLQRTLATWPYFVLLGVAIGLTEIYLIRKARRYMGRLRQPWTLDRFLVKDVIAAVLTIEYFALIHIFARPHKDGSLWAYTVLFLKAFGIHLN